jgi:hypothetical protein
VLDGGFDIVTACTASDCTSPVWAEGISGGNVGPLCQIGTGSCGYFQGPSISPLSPPHWAQLGGETHSGDTAYAIEQVVNIPAGPTNLSFQLLIKDSNVSIGAFTAQIDGTPVFAAGGATPGHASYAPVTVDITPFSGGLRTLRFDVIDTNISGSTDSFNVDDVSINDRPVIPAAPVKKKCKKGKKLKHGKCRKKHKKH